jgi:hypothetical protein
VGDGYPGEIVAVECTVCGWKSAAVGAHSGLVTWLEDKHLDECPKAKRES